MAENAETLLKETTELLKAASEREQAYAADAAATVDALVGAGLVGAENKQAKVAAYAADPRKALEDLRKIAEKRPRPPAANGGGDKQAGSAPTEKTSEDIWKSIPFGGK